MNKHNTYYYLAWVLIILGAVVTVWYLALLNSDGWGFIGIDKMDIEKSGQFGDYIGGFVGTLFSLAGFIFLYLNLKEQRQAFRKERFENHFFELINLHRENISEQNYSKFNGTLIETSTNRKVMRIIFQEFIECYREVKKFSNSRDTNDYITKRYQKTLQDIKKANNIRGSIFDMAIIDIAYCIVFFGVGIEGEAVLRDRFKNKYNGAYFYRLLAFLKLKPKKENSAQYTLWAQLRNMKLNELKKIIEEVYTHRSHLTSIQEISESSRDFLSNNPFEKYYGGHQHRLGHYFRHLFQSYKFLNENKSIKEEDRYFYGKTFRAQLSTYEQALLFINSISSLGFKWEYEFEQDKNIKSRATKGSGLITKYHLIKNLPGNHFFGITYKDYYPKVNYENKED